MNVKLNMYCRRIWAAYMRTPLYYVEYHYEDTEND